MLKKLNLSAFFAQMAQTVRRFPVATLLAVALCATNIILIARSYSAVRLNMVLALGFVLAVGARVLAESLALRGWRGYVDVAVLPLMALYFVLLPYGMDNFTTTTYICYVVFCIVALLLLGVAPWRETKNPVAFWQYNVKVWMRLALSYAFAAVFFVGFMLALFAVRALFDVDVAEMHFRYLIIVLNALFAPLFFAAGIPKQYEAQADTEPFLRVLGQYILLPILATYLVILYVYGSKIVLAWELPHGMLTQLVVVYSVVGILTYFILHNLYLSRANRIAVGFGRWFFCSELPLVALLAVAVFRRAADYGITENRYYVALFGAWLLGVSVYMICTRGKRIRPLLVSLGVVALLSLVGGWSAFSVSSNSQFRRLERLMTASDLLQDGKYVGNELKTVDEDAFDQMQDIVLYFAKKEDVAYLQPLFVENVDSLAICYNQWELLDYLLKNIRPNNRLLQGRKTAKSTSFTASNSTRESISVSGYDIMIKGDYSSYWQSNGIQVDSTIAYVARPNTETGVVDLYYYGKHYKTINIRELIGKIVETAGLADDDSPQPTEEQLTVVVDENYKVVLTSLDSKIDSVGNFILIGGDYYILQKK